MIKNKYIILIICFVSLAFHEVSAQRGRNIERKGKVFLGLYGGVNFTLPIVTERHSIISGIESQKDYEPMFNNLGSQFGFIVSYGLTNRLSLVAQPGYYTYNFRYITSYSWQDTISNLPLDKEMHHVQNASYFTIPILLKWDFTVKKFSPYVQVGGFIDILHQSNKFISYDYTIDGLADKNQVQSTPTIGLNNHLNKVNAGVVAGVGISYNAKKVIIGLESNFRFGLVPIVNNRNRYADHTGFAAQHLDVLDQFTLANLNFQITLTFPIGGACSDGMFGRTKYSCYNNSKKIENTYEALR